MEKIVFYISNIWDHPFEFKLDIEKSRNVKARWMLREINALLDRYRCSVFAIRIFDR